ncbi:nuclear apoptosis-inducing factor 1-like [Notolabrus celidotus]|uniref:nuclear apoptosis-inducing factor 1-like n=1 Tax=Notolabrus celidotus TaxID=1203425 RepID=UPI00148FCF8F|nr:nuclear apoptosis-inducing factor 1-like [Notolabrus celidotus]
MADKRTKKRNFSESEIETLVGEVESRKNVLFGSHGTGVTNKKKCSEWQQVAAAVNTVSGTERTVPELKKKWSDLKVEAKRRIATHRQSVTATGGGTGTPELTPLEDRMASILGVASVCGIVSEREGDTDMAQATDEPELEVPGGEAPGGEAAGVEARGARPVRTDHAGTSEPRAHGASGRVLTDAVLQSQRHN